MKKTLLTLLGLIAMAHFGYTQNTNPWPSTGPVGIGTASPTMQLHVVGANALPASSGSAANNGILRLGAPGTTANIDFGVDATAIGGGWIQARSPTNNSLNQNLVFNPNGGNVGIGTTTPAGRFQVVVGATDFLVNGTTFDIGTGGLTGGWARSFRVVNTSGSNGLDGGTFGVRGSGAAASYVYMSIPTTEPVGYLSTKILALSNAGNVGVGTTTPSEKLTVQDDVNDLIGRFQNTTAGTTVRGVRVNGKNVAGTIQYLDLAVDATNGAVGLGLGTSTGTLPIGQTDLSRAKLMILNNGNIGVGTTTPGTTAAGTAFSGKDLHIASSTTGARITVEGSSFAAVDVINSGSAANTRTFQLSNANDVLAFRSLNDSGSPRNVIMNLTGAGNVGIGTAQPDQKLTVNGSIHAKEVKVNLGIPLPDYVFEPSYKMLNLDDLKAYLEAHHHLPDMPAAAEVEKKGLNLGEMNMKLLKKVEELTLYAIRQQKENEQLKKEQQELKQNQQQQIDQLKEQLLALTKKLAKN